MNQNLPIGDENDYDFGNILFSYSVLTRFSLKLTRIQQFNITYKPLYVF